MDLLGLGRLPGDLRVRVGRVTVPFPITTTLVVSAVATLLFMIASRTLL